MSTYYGFVYFISNGTAIKIGYSGAPHARMGQLQTSSPTKLKMLATIAGNEGDEGELHQRFRVLKMEGEWFRPGPELIEFIKAVPDCSIDDIRVFEPWTILEPDPVPAPLPELPPAALDQIDALRRHFTPRRNKTKEFCAQQRLTNILILCDNILKEPGRPELWTSLHDQIKFHESFGAAG